MIPGIEKLGLRIEPEKHKKLGIYLSQMQKWNTRINLTASNDVNLLESLLLEGVWASQFYDEGAARHLDIGSGAGFPAIPLHIMKPEIRMVMIESRFKKVCFLENVLNKIEMTNTDILHARIGDYLDKKNNTWDCFSWKGLKINTRDLIKMKRHSHNHTQFWIFHGEKLSVEDPLIIEEHFRLLREEKFPFKSTWILSIYLPK